MRVLVIDDYALVREGLQHALQGLADVVDVLEASDAEQALRVVANAPALDLILLDIGLPGMDGFLALDQMRRGAGSVPIVVFSASANSRDITAALNMGAMGYIPKVVKREVLLRALRLVLAGGIFVPPQALGVPPSLAQPPIPPLAPPDSVEELDLTERQRQVLQRIAQGKPNKIIAQELAISEPTVKAHVTEVLRALRASSRAQAMVTARRLGVR